VVKLALLGAAVLALGLVLSVPGLLAAGGLWIVTGPLLRAFARQREADGTASRSRVAVAGVQGIAEEPAVEGRSFALGILLLLAIGLPSLALGIFEIGFPEPERAWRFVPIAIGGLVTALAVVSGGLMAIGSGMEVLGSGLQTTAKAIGAPEHPATITIRSARETGTYINNRPRLEFELTVEPDGQPAYEVTKQATVPHTALGSIRAGDGFRALVLPEKPTVMEIDWDSPIPGSGKGDASERVAELEELRRTGKISAEEFERHRQRILGSI
jgi:hypothetical protein